MRQFCSIPVLFSCIILQLQYGSNCGLPFGRKSEHSNNLALDLKGTSIRVRFDRVVDGDTIRVFLPSKNSSESIRILCLDTEETFPGGSKPNTPWGLKAKDFAERFFDERTVTLELPGREPVQKALNIHRGNFDRVLAFVFKGKEDYQAVMIQKGFSPYFTKYGNANFARLHTRYVRAERAARSKKRGVWNQIAVNGFVARNYTSLKKWWDSRAARIDRFRSLRGLGFIVYDPRVDYMELSFLARRGAEVTIFAEVSVVQRVSGSLGIAFIGSRDRPFALKIPNIDTEDGNAVVDLLERRYIGSAPNYGIGYFYATGVLELFRGNPQLVIANTAGISDRFPISPA